MSGLVALLIVASLGILRAAARAPRVRLDRVSLNLRESAGSDQEDLLRFLTKRAFDIAFAAISLIAMLPMLAVISVAVKLSSRGPVLIRQRRIGKRGEVFEYLKFRTMVASMVPLEQFTAQLLNVGAFPDSLLAILRLQGDPRVTSVGRILRRYGLDELPVMVNILKGDMSVIGPRAPLPAEVLAEPSWAMDRRIVTPGSVSPRWLVTTSYDYELALAAEVNYARQHSFWLDVRVLFGTVGWLFAGASEPSSDLDAIAGFLASLRAARPRDEHGVREIVSRLVEQIA